MALASLSATALGLSPLGAWAQGVLPTRTIPSSGESLPIVGLGSTRAVDGILELGSDRVASILRALRAHGGRVVDTWPREPRHVSAFGNVLSQPELRDELFVTINIAQTGRQEGIDRFEHTMSAYGRETIDLVNVGSLIDLDVQWANLKSFKDEGRARYIGVTAAQPALYDQLESFLERETPDVVEINYSVTERDAERRMLPMFADRGIAVLVSRPFMNGAYFERLEGEPLPAWTAEFECRTWAQFSLQYILAHAAITCVLTETTNPAHMAENAQSGMGPIPDENARRRMREFIDSI